METKAFYLSRGFWGAVFAIAAPILTQTGVPFTEADQKQAVDAALLVVAGAGGLVALWGRKKATAPLGLKTVVKVTPRSGGGKKGN